MKIAISGKGGVGKSTISSIIIETFAEMGKKVLAIDSDPSPHLARLLGFEHTERITPIAEMNELLLERSERQGAFYNLNPKVDDLPEKFMLERDNIKLMVVGAIQKGGGGCACAENAVLRNLVNSLLLNPQEVIVMDMEAGVEHLGRGTIQSVDHLLTVVQPYRGSIETARKIKRLADDLGIKTLKVIGNQVAGREDEDFIEQELGMRPFFSMPFSPEIRAAERKGVRVYSCVPDTIKNLIKNALNTLQNN